MYLNDSGDTERNISTATTSVTLDRNADTAEVTAFGNDDKAYIAGLKDATWSVEGSRDATIEGYVDGILGSARFYRIFPEGSSSGKVYYEGTAICTAVSPSSDVGDANKWSASFQNTGAITRTTV